MGDQDMQSKRTELERLKEANIQFTAIIPTNPLSYAITPNPVCPHSWLQM